MIFPFNCAPKTRLALRAGSLGLALVSLPGLLPANIPWPDEDQSPRRAASLNDGWRSTADDDSTLPMAGFELADFDDGSWQAVAVPHNWDGYEGFRQNKHGVFHGSAWYRRDFSLLQEDRGRRVFVMFEGVGSYATVWVNGKLIGHHGGGLTTFTMDVTHAVRFDGPNLLAVRADHPHGIRDLPWVCGGCELSYGFSEGTQPFGISRPVHLIVTDSLRIEPFGVHIWNDETISAEQAVVRTRTTIRNYGGAAREFALLNRLINAKGGIVAETRSTARIRGGATSVLSQDLPTLRDPQLWSPDRPYLYTLETVIEADGIVIDRIGQPYGIRWIQWPDIANDGPTPLLINGKPFFINGVADYEHLMGQSHAFSDEQVLTRIRKIRAAGFNAFRDAHHPHNLRFSRYFDREGMLWWTQNGAQIWFDNDNFRRNYKALVRDWMVERRNSPSLILYGLQNESKLPEWFTHENVTLMRELDPTASIQRLIASCNGGEGTDWDIPQNWTGTYGGDPTLYADDLLHQRLVGEYGAWRNLELHNEDGWVQDGAHTEGRMNALMEMKVRLAESVRDRVIGHFMWPFTTHQNPGRNVGTAGTQTRDGIRELDQIGPANNKGLQTIWGEPLDVFYMYRANYAPAESEPMVYIASHTWPDRWTEPGVKDGIIIYSNCDEVELFDDFEGKSLGSRTRGPIGTHFRWDGVGIRHNLLHAVGRVDGEVVASDIIQLHHLPKGAGWERLKSRAGTLPLSESGRHYLVRVNAGGPDYTDSEGNLWQADSVYRDGDSWGSVSWASAYPNLHPVFGSKREIFDPIRNTRDDGLFQSFRYGRDQLRYVFNVPDGDYTLELYFIEPWYGTGGGIDCTGWRLFDVAVNGNTVIENLDIWAAVGRAGALKKSVRARAIDGRIELSFPRVLSTQAVISAIALASDQPAMSPLAAPSRLIQQLESSSACDIQPEELTWMDTGERLYNDAPHAISDLAWELRESEWIRFPTSAAACTAPDLASFRLRDDADVFVAHDPAIAAKPGWLKDWDATGWTLASSDSPHQPLLIYRKAFSAGDTVRLGPNSLSPSEGRMYAVIVKQARITPPAQHVSDLVIKNSLATVPWQAVGNFRAGRRQYVDGGPVVQWFSSQLSDADWIRTAQADAANADLSASFTAGDHLEIFVAVDKRVTELPAWLDGWIESLWLVNASPGEHLEFRLLRHRAGPGETVTLGANPRLPDGRAAQMYSVILRTIRAAQYYPAENLISSNHFVDWKIAVDAGDRYNLNFRYTHEAASNITADYEILSMDGRVVCFGTMDFPRPAADSGWSVSRNRTCNSINAGTYIIRIQSPDILNITFDELEVE